ncbi:4-carboxymuconolactone decarboxylase [Agrobacterium tumefaciens]|jgi:4-carboxymuconolactone decarboxylase|uniref:4-carboxymuconolactone decarboxylase n=1 Tax=Agrobacterium fabrum (strain C58 / ATCC 33970) TaxID=176299 RepID=A9CLJ3_AGRFC|nr:carboxymuconolactone decarboxylase family protein [Agrobacterium fabrum]KEY54293.1 4-carboxymuconolactone decarboxylase [Agrobacterium tumefaciens]AAK90596.1 4-carboxymuconolactone decarboxylase [Agrobacterium fabrum str. C58]KJX90325.1 4-carboxymuconolactone decarboxylase [Agrobacterium tumefaciens]MCX2875426.1 carboxymuconolactone decarboxylase family protein [Agrobacterium fabrum]NMV70670.1 4-carboxymuconolactone decarboxylase [Agrobacterium fabrum]
MDKPLQQAGEAVRRKVLGDSYVDRALEKADDFSRPFQDILNEYCWGMAWTDDALDLKQRSLLNLGMLAALGRMHEFRIHFRGALRNGLTEAELRAALTQIAVYCGIPAGVEAFRAAQEVRAEMQKEAQA